MTDSFAVIETEDQEQIIFLPGYEDCLIGTGETFLADGVRIVAIYDLEKLLSKIAKEYEDGGHEGCDCVDHDYRGLAEEWYSYNIIGSYIGAGMPVFVTAKGEQYE